MKLNENDKNEIIKLINEKVSINDIIKKFNISKATYYRLNKIKNDDNKNDNVSVVSFNENVEIIENK